MISNDEYVRLLKLFSMLSSSNEGEILNAVSAIGRVLNAHALAWPDIILPRKLLPARVDPSDSLAGENVARGPKAFGAASPKEMLDALMTCANVSSETRRDLRDYARSISESRLSPAIRADIQALYNYAIIGGRQV